MWPWSENRLLKSALRSYAGDHVLSRVLAKGPEALALAGERKELTMMFIDIAGFTVPDTTLPSDSLAPFLNGYLQTVTDSILALNGVLDTYTGDAVISWWESPKDACLCAKQIVERLESLNGRNTSAQLPLLRVGIGLNTGIVTLGNYGSSQRMRFTVLGDNVNLASRLCGLANTQSQYQVPILMSGATQRLVADTIQTRELGTVRVKGKDDPITLFTLAEF
jgi:adenylate cyclase